MTPRLQEEGYQLTGGMNWLCSQTRLKHSHFPLKYSERHSIGGLWGWVMESHSRDPLACTWTYHAIWGLWCQKQISQAGLSNYTPQLTAGCNHPDSKVHGANMGPILGRQDPGGPHVGPMNFAIWILIPAWDTCFWHQSLHMWHVVDIECVMKRFDYNVIFDYNLYPTMELDLNSSILWANSQEGILCILHQILFNLPGFVSSMILYLTWSQFHFISFLCITHICGLTT